MDKFVNSAVTSNTGFVPMDKIDGIAKNINDLRNDVNNLYVIFYKTFDSVGVGKFKIIQVCGHIGILYSNHDNIYLFVYFFKLIKKGCDTYLRLRLVLLRSYKMVELV